MDKDVASLLREILDPHLNKKLTVERAEIIEREVLLKLLGVRPGRKRNKGKSGRTCVVSMPTGGNEVNVQQVEPAPHGTIPNSNVTDGIVIGKPEIDA